mgnify:CR=1 FL=1|tara:strand:+ start:3067 stop:5415 length:2349 start_codon:yes stop_codon:yes gene_type:complete
MKETLISVFRDLYTPKETPFIVPLWKSLERIRVGKSKDTIDYANQADDKETYDKRKSKLPCVVFGGQFKERAKKGLIEHSGLMVIDFDEMKTKKELNRMFNEVKQNKHLVTLFISPSRKGFKGVVKIPKCNALEHEMYFKAFAKKFDYDYFDNSNCNVDRVCYESYDPNIYINYDAEIFDPELVDIGYEVKDKIPLIPLDNESDIIEKIMKFDWGKDFVEGERNTFIFDIAGMFCEYGISQTTAEGYIFNNVVIGDFSERECKNTIKSAYKIRQFNTKYFENYKKIESIKSDLNKGKDVVLEKYDIDEQTYDGIREVSEAEDFWYYQKEKVKVNPLKYKQFLEGNGFKKYYPDGGDKPTFVKVESNKVEVTSTAKIKDFVLDYLAEAKEFEVWKYCASFQNLFAEQFLLMLDSIDLMMLRDDIDKSYIAFNNGILEVSKNGYELKEYIDVQGYIWKSHILDRDWKHVKEHNNDYSKFVFNISDKEPFPIESCIGYLLHTYKNRSNNKAIILNDEIITQNPEGGTGKGLFIQGVSNIRKTHIIDGKSHNDKANFQNQSVSLDDKILVFDDIPKNFNFENQFSLITEGITIRHLYKDPIKLSVQDSPKIVLSTNYAVKGEGNSHDRRRHEIEIAQHYGKDLTPDEEFGRQLFDEWDENEYHKFDNYMVYCIQVYLKNGLIKQNAKNIKLRKFIAETSMEFYEWFNDSQKVQFNTRNDKKEFYNLFIDEYPDFKRWLNQRTFTKWISKWASFNDYEYKKGNSNGLQWFEIINTDAPIEDDNGIAF